MASLVPGSVPRVFMHDPGAGMLVMEDLRPLTTMRNGMLARARFPRFADQISTLLASLCFHTSDHASPARKRELMARFANPELCEITDKLIFTAPYHDDPGNRVHPLLRPYLETKFWPREDVRIAAGFLKRKFQSGAECLIHGDLHTGSIFADESRSVAFDAEFATVGPAGFDIGKLIGNLVINHQCWRGRNVPTHEADAYRSHVLELIRDTYSGFQQKLEMLLREHTVDPMAKSEGYRERYLCSVFEDAVGFCATTLVRRMFGLAQNVDVEGIEDPARRCEVQVAVLECAMDLLVHRERFATIEDVVQRVRAD
jgi:5-methylthioribose kinase